MSYKLLIMGTTFFQLHPNYRSYFSPLSITFFMLKNKQKLTK